MEKDGHALSRNRASSANRALNTLSPKIPMRVVLDNEYGGEGEFLKHKVRMTVSGHKYNMQKGVHYDDVFAPAPNQNTSRLLSALHTCTDAPET